MHKKNKNQSEEVWAYLKEKGGFALEIQLMHLTIAAHTEDNFSFLSIFSREKEIDANFKNQILGQIKHLANTYQEQEKCIQFLKELSRNKNISSKKIYVEAINQTIEELQTMKGPLHKPH